MSLYQIWALADPSTGIFYGVIEGDKNSDPSREFVFPFSTSPQTLQDGTPIVMGKYFCTVPEDYLNIRSSATQSGVSPAVYFLQNYKVDISSNPSRPSGLSEDIGCKEIILK